jgi:hypothetical protein
MDVEDSEFVQRCAALHNYHYYTAIARQVHESWKVLDAHVLRKSRTNIFCLNKQGGTSGRSLFWSITLALNILVRVVPWPLDHLGNFSWPFFVHLSITWPANNRRTGELLWA